LKPRSPSSHPGKGRLWSRGTRCGAPADDSPQRELWVGSRNGDKPRRGDRSRDPINGRILKLPPARNGEVTSPSPFRSAPQGDEDVATPKPFSHGPCVERHLPPTPILHEEGDSRRDAETQRMWASQSSASSHPAVILFTGAQSPGFLLLSAPLHLCAKLLLHGRDSAVAPGAEHRQMIAHSVSCGLAPETETSPGGATDPGTASTGRS
jgi:hypothetical protein